MSKYSKKVRDYGSWFDDPAFQDFVNSIHGGQGSIQDSDNGLLPGGKDYANMYYQYWMQNQQNQWQQNMYREDRAWQEDMYERYQSIGGQIDQMRQNGINPMMMFAGGGVNAPAVQSGQIPSSGSGASAPGSSTPRTNSFQQLMGIFQMLTGLAGTGVNLGQGISQMVRNNTMNEKDKSQASLFESQRDLALAEAEGKRLENAWQEKANMWQDYDHNLKNDKIKAEINALKQQVANGQSQIRLNHSIIEVNGKQVDLLSSYKQLADSQKKLVDEQKLLLMVNKTLANLEVDKMEAMKPYFEKMAKAQFQLTNSQTYLNRQQGNLAFRQAALDALEAIKQQGLLDAGIVDEMIKGMQNERRNRTAMTFHAYFDSMLDLAGAFL